MTTFIYISLGVSVLAYILLWLTSIEVEHEFKRRYPGLKEPKNAFSEQLTIHVKAILLCFLPGINVVSLCTMLCNGEDLKEAAIEKRRNECLLYKDLERIEE